MHFVSTDKYTDATLLDSSWLVLTSNSLFMAALKRCFSCNVMSLYSFRVRLPLGGNPIPAARPAPCVEDDESGSMTNVRKKLRSFCVKLDSGL